MSAVVWRGSFVAMVLVGGCGPSIDALPLEELECREIARTSAGCSFVAVPVLHLASALGEAAGIPRTAWEPDGIVVANPGHEDVRVQPRAVRSGSTDAYALERVFTLAPGEHRLVTLPTTAEGDSTQQREGSLIGIDADAPIVASLYGPYRPFLGNDSALLLPRSAWGRHYVVASYAPHSAQFQGVGEPTYFEIVAAEDDTEVKWWARFAATAGGNAIDGVAAGDWSTSHALDANEVLRVTAASLASVPGHARDLSGTVIEASAPIWVVAGSRCSSVPAVDEAVSGCDPLFEAAIPIESWGRTHAVPHPPARTNEQHHYRVYAGDADVELTTSPPVVATHVFAARGDYIDIVVPHGTSFAATATGPTLVVGYLETRDPTDQIGDPAMYQVVPEEQWLTRYAFVTGVEWRTHLVEIVRRRDGAAPVRLDGEAIDAWEPFGEHEVAVLEIREGAHVLEGDTAFGATQFGWTNEVADACVPYAPHATCQTSYAHPAGMRTERLLEP